jgi:hypothetical protein
MTRIWDIIDKVEPAVEVTQRNENAVNLAPAGVQFKLRIAAGLILAVTTTSFCVQVSTQRQTQPATVGMHKKANESVRPGRLARSGADTPHAMSGPKLAATFSALFKPTEEDEAEYEGDYFFG